MATYSTPDAPQRGLKEIGGVSTTNKREGVSPNMYQGILIDRSVADVNSILSSVHILGEQKGSLESEDFRGDVRFISIEVDEAALWVVLKAVAESLKAPGWFFHVVGNGRLYVVLPRVIFFADEGKTEEIDEIVQYAVSQGIHPNQLNLARHFADPFA